MTNQAQNQAFEDALHNARIAILKAITESVEDVQSASVLKDFAEAFAFTVQPNQSH